MNLSKLWDVKLSDMLLRLIENSVPEIKKAILFIIATKEKKNLSI